MPDAKTFGGGAPCVCAQDLETHPQNFTFGQTQETINVLYDSYSAPATILTINFNTLNVDDIYLIISVDDDATGTFAADLDGNTVTATNTEVSGSGDIGISDKVYRFPAIPIGAHVARLLITNGANVHVYDAWLKVLAILCLAV
jgi:hypothetical protein